MSTSIDELQRRIAELQLGITAKPVTPVVNPVEQDIKTLIRQAIREEMSLLKDSTVVQPEPPVVPVRELSMLEAIGQCLAVEEQTWLSRPEVLGKVERNLINYMQTGEGKSAVKGFVTYFRGLYEN